MQTRIFPLLGVLLVLGACGRPAPPPEHSGELIVGTRNSPASYYIDHNGEPAGFEHDLIQAFSESQSWNLSWVEKNRPEALWEQVNLTRVHMAAAGLPLKVVESRKLKAGPVLYETPVHVVYRLAERKPRKVSDLFGKRIGMIIGSGHTPMLMRLKRKHPELQWEALENVWPEELLVQLREGRYDAVVISGMDFDLSRKFFPELAVAFDFEDTQKIVWAMPAHTSKAFIEKVRSFVEGRPSGRHHQAYPRALFRSRQAPGQHRHRRHFAASATTAAPIPPLLPGSADPQRNRLAAAGRDRLPGVAVGSQCSVAHRRSRPDDADWADRGSHGGKKPPRSAPEHHRRRALSGIAEGQPAAPHQ
jgi:ABC-type amino acid transport substrate-binding protein